MDIQVRTIGIVSDDETLAGTVLAPPREVPGILFVHGWGGHQAHDLARAREAAGLGCVCLTFDLRGHQKSHVSPECVTRPQNLEDIVAAYDWLVAQPSVDPGAIAVVGISYGGYLASILTSLRSVRWLALRSPAIYKDENWELPKLALHTDPDLPRYRRRRIDFADNRALRACAEFRGDVLIVAAEHDDIVPHQVTENYLGAFRSATSRTARVIGGADHAFSAKSAQRDYSDVLLRWLTEMIVGARGSAAKEKVALHKIESGLANA
ncbi:MAG TPA: alpha/beta fold hydrolase [Rhodanobacteraceae bacterium]|nr:alpha/beta fold hydrolase [Rhodanobacteraceae bacterium]